MEKVLSATVVALSISILALSPALGEQRMPELIYRFDPALSIEGPRPHTISNDPNVLIEKREDKTSLRLQTDGPITPYLDAEEGPELFPDERRLMQDKLGRDSLADYRLEAGIGVKVEDTTSLNLGYRFRTQPTLLDERRNDPLSLTGDLRVTFDIKVPFD